MSGYLEARSSNFTWLSFLANTILLLLEVLMRLTLLLMTRVDLCKESSQTQKMLVFWFCCFVLLLFFFFVGIFGFVVLPVDPFSDPNICGDSEK